MSSEGVKVAVDLDDVVVDTAEHVIQHYNAKYGTEVTLEDFYKPNISEVWGTPDDETAVQRVNEYLLTEEYHELLPGDGALYGLSNIKERGYEPYIVTGRPNFVEEATRRYLMRHFPNVFHGVEFTNYFSADLRRDKGEICRRLGAEIGIDDHIDHARSMAAAGIEVILFGNYPWNQTDELPEGVTRCVNWPAVLEYFDERG